jgi:DNA repair protein RadC
MRAPTPAPRERLMNLANPPRNNIGDRAGPRYTLRTFQVALRVREPGAKVDSVKAAVPILRQILGKLDADQEHFIVLALGTKLAITGFKVVSSGGISGTVVDPRIVFRSALLLGAESILVAHNHPSGVAEPSADDRGLTRTLVAAGRMLDLPVQDHIILGRDVYSFANHGELR